LIRQSKITIKKLVGEYHKQKTKSSLQQAQLTVTFKEECSQARNYSTKLTNFKAKLSRFKGYFQERIPIRKI
jgi:hypothetical protein